MCNPTNIEERKDSASGSSNMISIIAAVCGIVIVAELGFLIRANGGSSAAPAALPDIYINAAESTPAAPATVGTFQTTKPPQGENPCAGKKPGLKNIQCVVDAITNVGPQAGANVTKGYKGDMEVDHVPVTTPYWMNGMCPVNVHWHLGAEHYSLGEYDETGTGPGEMEVNNDGDVREGYLCKHYDETDAKFTTPFDWKHCVNMEVGQTYEVHWPHSAAGACGTLNQYQTPFYDGVFCVDDVLTDTASQVGVQAQIFTIVNDESYYYPDLMRGMIVDGDFGKDIAKYTGSTTGTSRNNEICSQYSPITWQVDRKCHMVSASTFDKMCADMKAQRDDMRNDLYPHGSRELVADHLAANNQHDRNRLRRA